VHAPPGILTRERSCALRQPQDWRGARGHACQEDLKLTLAHMRLRHPDADGDPHGARADILPTDFFQILRAAALGHSSLLPLVRQPESVFAFAFVRSFVRTLRVRRVRQPQRGLLEFQMLCWAGAALPLPLPCAATPGPEFSRLVVRILDMTVPCRYWVCCSLSRGGCQISEVSMTVSGAVFCGLPEVPGASPRIRE
jgi:hypothetical protein